MPLVTASVLVPPPEASVYVDRWGTVEATVLTCWHNGLQKRKEQGWAETAAQASAGELPLLPWRGGVDPEAKSAATKVGTLQYLAMWQGLRGEDLAIDTGGQLTVTCTRTGVKMTFQLSPGEDPANDGKAPEAGAPAAPVEEPVAAISTLPSHQHETPLGPLASSELSAQGLPRPQSALF